MRESETSGMRGAWGCLIYIYIYIYIYMVRDLQYACGGSGGGVGGAHGDSGQGHAISLQYVNIVKI